MTQKTIPELDDGESFVSNTDLVPFSTGGATRRAKISTLVSGPTIVYVHKLDDLPPLIGGFRTLAQNTAYIICNQINISDEILIPAGWNGFFQSSHLPFNALVYLGTNALFNTLGIDGTILSIADSGTEPGAKSTITTSVAHGLTDGQFVNIEDTTDSLYSQQRLQISNVTASTFDVEIVFVATDTGTFDTGYFAIQFFKMPFFNTGGGTLFDITATPDPDAVFAFDNFAAFNFLNMGIIRKSAIISLSRGQMTFFGNGIIIEDCDTMGLGESNFSNINPADTTSKCITITGSATRDIVLLTTKLNVANAAQRPVRIDPSVITADAINIQNCPDNNVAPDYFDISAGGLDQTNKQVITFKNGKRADSADQAEAMSDIIVEVVGVTIGVAEPIEDITPAANDFIFDPATEGFTLDDLTGIVTYNGRAPLTVRIEYALEAAQTSGSAQDLDIALRLNGVEQTKTIRSMTTMGVGSFTPISYLGGFFDITPGDTLQLFKTNNTNTNNTDIQNLVVLIK